MPNARLLTRLLLSFLRHFDAGREVPLAVALLNVCGPGREIRMDDLVRQYLIANRDPRQVTTDPQPPATSARP